MLGAASRDKMAQHENEVMELIKLLKNNGQEAEIHYINTSGMNRTLNSINEIYKGGKQEDILLDLHCWVECEEKHGTIVMDYDNKKLKKVSLYGTNKIIRKPFPEKLAAECLPYILEVTNAKIKIATEMRLLEESFDYWFNNTGNCCCRAVMVYKALKKEGKNPKLKIGSLGFIQPNNKDVFFEYG